LFRSGDGLNPPACSKLYGEYFLGPGGKTIANRSQLLCIRRAEPTGRPATLYRPIYSRNCHNRRCLADSEIRFPEREALQMTSPAEYRRRARHFLQMAQNCRDSQIAARLRVIAADYFEAGQGGGEAFQQQQQVQHDKDAE